jgi:putative PIN family toxin of toxin-antitoxin system
VKPIYIIDTNVVVAGLISSQTDSPVVRILDNMLSAAFPFVVSTALLAEYRNVLLRPKLTKLHGLSAEQIDNVLTELAQHGIVLTPPAGQTVLSAPDPGDQFLWDLLALRSDLLLVTGDQRLLRDVGMGQRVVAPQDLASRLHH